MNAVYLAIDTLYAKQFKEKITEAELFNKSHIYIIGKDPVPSGSTNNLLILQAKYWPKLKKRLSGNELVLIVGNLMQFYSWAEAVGRFPAAYCTPLDPFKAFIHSIISLQKGDHFLSKMMRSWLQEDSRNKQKHLLKIPLSKPLTSTEIQILSLIGKGEKSSQIASLQHRSIHTITTHRKNIRRKIKSGLNSSLTVFAAKNQIALKTLLKVEEQNDVWQEVLKLPINRYGKSQ